MLLVDFHPRMLRVSSHGERNSSVGATTRRRLWWSYDAPTRDLPSRGRSAVCRQGIACCSSRPSTAGPRPYLSLLRGVIAHCGYSRPL